MKKASFVAMVVAGFCLLSLQAGEPFKVSEFSFKCPEGWKEEQPSSRMRAAELSVPGKDGGDAAEVTFFYFGAGQGGDAKANVSRWLGQIENRSGEKTTSKDVNGTKVTYVEAEGTFLSGPPFGAKIRKEGYGLVGAIVEGKQGNVFVKMTGPKALTSEASEAFKGMIEGALK